MTSDELLVEVTLEMEEVKMSQEIKPCPGCSPRYSNPKLRNETPGYTVMCYGFDCREWSGWHNTEHEAITAWNRRAEEVE